MSISWLPREQGIRLTCNGTNEHGCPTKEKRVVGIVIAMNVRSWFAKREGWGRGLRSGYKRRDLCKSCRAIEEQLFKKQGAAFEAEKQRKIEERKARRAEKKAARDAEKQRLKQQRAEERQAKRAARAAAKKPRKRKASDASSIPASSPSADCAPAAST